MNEFTRDSLLALKGALEEDPRSLRLTEAEDVLSSSEEVSRLSALAKSKMEDYAYNREHFGDNSELTRNSLHELYLAKKALDEHPLSRAYQVEYAVVRNLYDRIDALLISPFREPLRCERRKA